MRNAEKIPEVERTVGDCTRRHDIREFCARLLFVNIKRGYGIYKRLHRGDRLLLFLTYRCPVQCFYCALRYASTDGSKKQPYGSMIKSKKQLGLVEWKYLVKSFPRRLREIQLTGGEPLIMPFYSELVNWLLDEDYFVTVFSSLYNLSGLDVRMTTERFLRYRISATYHRKMDVNHFKQNLTAYRAKYRVDVEEIETDQIKGSSIKAECHPEDGHTCVGFMYAPDGRIYHNVYELMEEYA